jgi:hypothetical protein
MALLASHHHHNGPKCRAVVWYLWLTELCGRDFCASTWMSPLSISLLVLHTLVLVVCCRHYINLAIDSSLTINHFDPCHWCIVFFITLSMWLVQGNTLKVPCSEALTSYFVLLCWILYVYGNKIIQTFGDIRGNQQHKVASFPAWPTSTDLAVVCLAPVIGC